MTREDAILIAEKTFTLSVPAFEVVNECAAELARATSLHGPMRGTHEGYAVILEELDELWDEVKRKKPDVCAMRTEALQVAAMALRFAVDVCGS